MTAPTKQPVTADHVAALLKPAQRTNSKAEVAQLGEIQCYIATLEAQILDRDDLLRRNATLLDQVAQLQTYNRLANERAFVAQQETIKRELAWTSEAGRLQAKIAELQRTVETQRERLQAIDRKRAEDAEY